MLGMVVRSKNPVTQFQFGHASWKGPTSKPQVAVAETMYACVLSAICTFAGVTFKLLTVSD